MNILIVEPSLSYSELIKGLLDSKEVTPSVAHSGADALSILQNYSPEAICVAYELGDMNSFEFIKTIKEKHTHIEVPMFLITSQATDEFKKKSYDAGYTEIFSKSDVTVLKNAFRSIMLYTTCHIKARVLYVEDVPSTAAYTMSIMTNLGWKVDHVERGEDALLLLQKEKYDLLITDLVLSGSLSGIGLISAVREQDYLRETALPVMAVSGWNDLLRQVFVLQHGCCDFVAKPFQETDFIARALNLIQTKRLLDASIKEKRLFHDKAHTDNLTGLFNRHFLDDYAEQLLIKAISQDLPVALMMIDIDYFKKTNDNYGHQVGDDVLSKVGNSLASNCRENDVAVRYGGEEFLLILSGCKYNDVINKAELLRKDIESLKIDNCPTPVTVSIGVSFLDARINSTIADMIKVADIALYKAKEQGRNRVNVMSMLEAVAS